ncbi:hypothetical protein B0H10DRAFT_2209467 [Mycena sp. CBHHK59/15]|nr:hypothetical protein B0H10DRAFT_2209467 [Mycena sp. CBHHK59/15]
MFASGQPRQVTGFVVIARSGVDVAINVIYVVIGFPAPITPIKVHAAAVTSTHGGQSTARAKIAAKLLVVFPPDSHDFFSCCGNNTLSVDELTEKYGETVFAAYDLDFGKADTSVSTKSFDGADDEGEGDDIGSEDSDEESESSDVGSVASVIAEDSAPDSEEDDSMSGEEDTSLGMITWHEEDRDQDGTWDGQAEFAAAYNISMGGLEDEIFSNGYDSDV